jgi:hypothetical protein
VRPGRHKGESIDDYDFYHTPIERVRRPGAGGPGAALTQAAAQGQSAPAPRAPSHEQQQGKINAGTVGFTAGLIEGAPSRLAVERARVVDDGTNLHVLPIVRLGTTERLYVRGADLVIINSGACALFAPAERLECLEKLSPDIAPPLRRPVSPSPD